MVDIAADGDASRFVIKTALVGHLLEHSLRPLIEKCVDYVSMLSHRGSLLINGYLLHRLDRGLDLPDFDAASWQRLARQAFVTEGTKRAPILGFTEFLHAELCRYPTLPAKPLVAMKALQDYAADQYARNFSTYLRTTMRARQRRYIEAWSTQQNQPAEKQDVAVLLSRINTWPSHTSYVMSREQTQFVAEERQVLGLQSEKLGDPWMERNLARVIAYQHRMLRVVEHGGDDAGRRWTIAPIHKIRSLMITIDTSVLYSLLKTAGLFGGNYSEFAAMRDDHWASVFRLKKGRRAAHYVQTDGVSLCTHYVRGDYAKKKRGGKKRKRGQTSPESAECAPEGRVIAIDPGRVNLVYAVERLPEGGVKTYTLTRRTYYHRGHISKANRHTRRWNCAIEDELQTLAGASPKTSYEARWLAYLQAVQQTYDALWAHFCRRRCGRLRLETHIFKQKTVDSFLASMKTRGQQAPHIAYGAAQVASGGRGELTVPCKEMYRQISKRYPTTLVDEFRSTKCCHRCICADVYSELLSMRRQRRGLPALEDNRGLRRCPTCRKLPLVSRDMNAALNIDLCFRLGAANRPRFLSRN